MMSVIRTVGRESGFDGDGVDAAVGAFDGRHLRDIAEVARSHPLRVPRSLDLPAARVGALERGEVLRGAALLIGVGFVRLLDRSLGVGLEPLDVEPTFEMGFRYLEQIQDFTGVSYGLSELQLVYDLFDARKDLAGNAAKQAALDQVANYINQLDFPAARASLDAATGIPEPAALPMLAAGCALMCRRRARRPHRAA